MTLVSQDLIFCRKYCDIIVQEMLKRTDKTEYIEQYDPNRSYAASGEIKSKFSALLEIPSTQQTAFSG